jgi:hypothetical protein
MILPNLFIPGAAKSGTSALHEYLMQHPQIFMSAEKEPHFFSYDINFQADSQSKLQEYAGRFEAGAGFPIRGESSTGYMVFPHVIERIQEIIPDPKFIFLLRNPIDRLYSHYWWLRGRGFETRSLEAAVFADMYADPDPMSRVFGFGGYRFYYQFGCYGKWLSRFYRVFGSERIKVITSEQLKADSLATLNGCFDFLGLSHLNRIATITANETVQYRHSSLFRLVSTFGIQSPLLTVAKIFVRGNARLWLKNVRKQSLQRLGASLQTNNVYPAMSMQEREQFALLYAEEVDTLRKLTTLDFHEWRADFPSA